MRTRLFLFAILIMAFYSCNKQMKKDAETIKTAEAKLSGNSVKFENFVNDGKKLVALYVDFARKYPSAPDAPIDLYKAGNMSVNIQNYPEALCYFDTLCLKYPKCDKVPMAIFQKAFINENYLHNLPEAEKLYKKFIADYPAHEMTPSAKASLKNLGKPVEELIKEFEKNNTKDSLKNN